MCKCNDESSDTSAATLGVTLGDTVLFEDNEGHVYPGMVVYIWNKDCVNLRLIRNCEEQPPLVQSISRGDGYMSWRHR